MKTGRAERMRKVFQADIIAYANAPGVNVHGVFAGTAASSV